MKVCVDAGHGMSNRTPGIYDPGAVHREEGILFREADITLAYARELDSELRLQGAQTFMSRSKFSDAAPIGLRVPAAVRAGCSTFVSLHLNDFDDDRANGLEVLFNGARSHRLALDLQTSLCSLTGMKNRGAKPRDDLAVLRFPGIAVLIELGFIANDSDRRKLLNLDTRQAIVQTIAGAVINPSL